MALEEEDRLDPKGCLFFALRFIGCSSILYVIMFAAILLVAVVALILNRF